MSNFNLESDNNPETIEQKKSCGKMKEFFTKVVKESYCVCNWKFGVLLVIAIIVIAWIIL